MAGIHISNDPSGRIIVSFPYDPILISKIKTIDGRRWHPDQKHWSFPNADGLLEKILKVFGDEDIYLDPTLKTTASKARNAPAPLAGEGWGEGYSFEELRRELVSRKYSHKTVKGYIYYNKDLINHVRKKPSEINCSQRHTFFTKHVSHHPLKGVKDEYSKRTS
ncbi:MAG: hypothetical protein ABIF87_05230 [Pseudomonadota bacterium]